MAVENCAPELLKANLTLIMRKVRKVSLQRALAHFCLTHGNYAKIEAIVPILSLVARKLHNISVFTEKRTGVLKTPHMQHCALNFPCTHGLIGVKNIYTSKIY